MAVYQKMLEDDIKPTIFTYSCLISCCDFNKDLDEAWKIFKEIQDNPLVDLDTAVKKIHFFLFV